MLTELLLAALLATERILNDKKMWLKIIGNANKQKECVYAYCCSEGRTRSLERQRKQQRERGKSKRYKNEREARIFSYILPGRWTRC